MILIKKLLAGNYISVLCQYGVYVCMVFQYSLTVDLLSEEILKNLQELGEGELSLPTPKKIK